MRTKSDQQWSQPSGAPVCGGCALPLLDGTRVCPFCERKVHGGPIARALHRGRRLMRDDSPGQRLLGFPEPVVLTIGIALFSAIAVASAALALLG